MRNPTARAMGVLVILVAWLAMAAPVSAHHREGHELGPPTTTTLPPEEGEEGSTEEEEPAPEEDSTTEEESKDGSKDAPGGSSGTTGTISTPPEDDAEEPEEEPAEPTGISAEEGAGRSSAGRAARPDRPPPGAGRSRAVWP